MEIRCACRIIRGTLIRDRENVSRGPEVDWTPRRRVGSGDSAEDIAGAVAIASVGVNIKAIIMYFNCYT